VGGSLDARVQTVGRQTGDPNQEGAEDGLAETWAISAAGRSAGGFAASLPELNHLRVARHARGFAGRINRFSKLELVVEIRACRKGPQIIAGCESVPGSWDTA